MDLADDTMSYVCRGCLSVELDMTNMAEDEGTLLMFTVCTQLKINENDDLPVFLCECCIKQCEAWLSFKTQCEESEIQLRKSLTELSKCKDDEFDNDSHTSLSETMKIEFLDNSSEMDEIMAVEVKRDKTEESHTVVELDSEVEDVDPKIDPFNMIDCAASVPLKTAVLPAKNTQNSATQTEISNTIADNATNANEMESIIKCQLCDRPCRNWGMLSRHLHQVHGVKPRRSYACTECDRIFQYPCKLEAHYVAYHGGEARFICEHCGKPFYNMGKLQEHKLTHVSEYLHLCDICPKKYKTKSQLRVHMLTHDKSRTYKCPLCDKELRSKVGITDHIRAFHEGFRTNSCKICGKSFATTKYLRFHERVHSGVQPHECEICKQKFSYASALKRHKYAHGKEKLLPFQCDMCDRNFAEKRRLNEHRHVHTGVRPHVCTECGKGFTVRSKLYGHLRAIHKKVIQRSRGRPRLIATNSSNDIVSNSLESTDCPKEE